MLSNTHERTLRPLLFICTVFLCIGVYTCFSQDLQTIATDVYSFSAIDYSAQQIEFLHDKMCNPIDINSIQESDLSQFCFLTPFEQKSIYEFVIANKPLSSIYELHFVLGLSVEKAELLSHFMIVKPQSCNHTLEELIHNGTHSIIGISQFPIHIIDSSSTNNNYLGNASKQAWRYRYASNGSLNWGVTLKKDSGELVSFKQPNIYDYASAYIQYKPNGIIRNITIGDYELQIAQGLLQWQGGYFGKHIRSQHSKTHCTLSKHSSGNETDLYRGIAFQLSHNSFMLTPFFSNTYTDGTLNSDSSNFILYNTGYHRTMREIELSNTIHHTVQGCHIQYSNFHNTYSTAIVQHSLTYANTIISKIFVNAAYSYTLKQSQIFTESAFDGKSTAHTIGIQTSVNHDITLLSSARYYQPNYYNIYSQSLSEQSQIHNEQGIFTSVICPISKFITFQCVHDYYYIPNCRYFVNAPTRGNELYVKLQYKNWEGVTLFYAWSNGYKTAQNTTERYNEIYTHITQFQKLYFVIPINSVLLSKTTIAQSLAENQRGTLVCQDLQYKPTKTCTIRIRYAHYSAPYNARIYAWEDNVEYSNTSHQYFNKGSHWYSLIEWQIHRMFRIEFKLSHTAIHKQLTVSETTPATLLCNIAVRYTIH